MAKRKGGSVDCPAKCGRKDFANAGAAASHLRLAKDSLHVAHRSAPAAVEPPAVSPAADPSVPPEPAPIAPPAPVVEVRQEKSAALAAEAQKATAQEKPADPPASDPAAIVVSWKAPQVVAPLAGTADQKATAAPGASPTGEQGPGQPPVKDPTVSEIPLEPFLAAGVASVINAFALDPAKGDRLMTTNEVAATGFPKALEVSVRKYWPNLPLDHPLVLLSVSGTALVAQVKAHRAPRLDPGTDALPDVDGSAPVAVIDQAPPPADAPAAKPRKPISAEAAALAQAGLA